MAANVSSAAAAVRFSPLSAAAHNVSRFCVVVGADFTAIPQRCRQSVQRHRQHPRADAAAAAAAAAATAVAVYTA